MKDEDLIGKTEQELRAAKIDYAVDFEDGQPCITTCDWNPARVRVELESGRVTRITGRG